MTQYIQPPAYTTYGWVPGQVLYAALYLLGLLAFIYIAVRRIAVLARARSDPRFDRPFARILLVAKFWLAQWKHPRYRGAGILHILVFAGFLILVPRALSLLIVGVWPDFAIPLLAGRTYGLAKDYAATVVFLCMVILIVRRIVFRPARYAVSGPGARGRAADAVFLLALIGLLMAADALFEGAKSAASSGNADAAIASVLSLPWLFSRSMALLPPASLGYFYHGAYVLHGTAFFFLLCYRPFGIQFHVETSLFSVFFGKLDRGALKPVRWELPEERLDEAKSLGIKTFEDFTWKHVLDFYSCADCGRCADQCPARTVGRPLSPRLLTTKARDDAYRHYPVFGGWGNGQPLVGDVYSADEVWSCTTCGACEAECPLLVEYIDKIVDLRRGMVDSGAVPQSLQKPLKSLESRGNPFGKPEKKRADWTEAPEFRQHCPVPVLNGDSGEDTLYFVDSVTSFDDRIRSIGRATARLLQRAGHRFGILGAAERDSGHEVRRFGEEALFLALRKHNTEAIRRAGVMRVVTNDPHAFNALRHDYRGLPPVEHISQTIARDIASGALRLEPLKNGTGAYAYHDPCYLGRHNGVFDEPRAVLDAIPGLKRVEMPRCRDRSFCCGGGGLALFYEPKEDRRMSVVRVEMAAEAGATAIVTACPFCMIQLEDGVKVAGLEGKMAVIDLTELVERQLASDAVSAPVNGA